MQYYIELDEILLISEFQVQETKRGNRETRKAEARKGKKSVEKCQKGKKGSQEAANEREAVRTVATATSSTPALVETRGATPSIKTPQMYTTKRKPIAAEVSVETNIVYLQKFLLEILLLNRSLTHNTKYRKVVTNICTQYATVAVFVWKVGKYNIKKRCRLLGNSSWFMNQR